MLVVMAVIHDCCCVDLTSGAAASTSRLIIIVVGVVIEGHEGSGPAAIGGGGGRAFTSGSSSERRSRRSRLVAAKSVAVEAEEGGIGDAVAGIKLRDLLIRRVGLVLEGEGRGVSRGDGPICPSSSAGCRVVARIGGSAIDIECEREIPLFQKGSRVAVGLMTLGGRRQRPLLGRRGAGGAVGAGGSGRGLCG